MTYFVQFGLQLNMQFIQPVDQINNRFEKKLSLVCLLKPQQHLTDLTLLITQSGLRN